MKKVVLSIIMWISVIIQSNAQHNTYYIGHSGFGWDLIVGEMVNDLATDAGITTYDYNFQYIGGRCISYQWVNHGAPDGGTDSWTELPNGYDYVVLAEQIPIEEVVYSNQWGCELTSVEAVDNFHDMATGANPSARIFLMEFHNEVNLNGATPYASWTQMNSDMRPLWEQVADSVALINPGGQQVCIVPVAAAFQAMADSVIAGSFPGITNWLEIFDPNDLPEATIHPTEETFYIVACVHFACIFGQSPVGLTNETFAAAGWQFDPPTPAQALMMQEIAWNVVSNDPYTCLPQTSSVSDIQSSTGFKLYPNPTDNILNISCDSFGGEVEIYDMFGKIILKRNIEESLEISIDFESSVYFVVYTNQKGNRFSEKLVVR